jgi:hypothetical protein
LRAAALEEATAMASMLNDTRVIGTEATVEQTEVSEGLRIARYCALEEFVGLLFGVITVGWIVMSLARTVL